MAKAASTIFKWMMVRMNDKSNSAKPSNIWNRDKLMKLKIRYLSEYRPTIMKSRLENYKSFMIARNPFERILSAFRDKFERHNTLFHTQIGKKIIRLFRENASRESLNKGHDVTFPEFVKYIIAVSASGGELNAHWRPIYRICFPLHIQFTFIAKYETLTEDMEYILQTMFGTDGCNLVKTQTRVYYNNIIKQYYSQIPEAHKIQLRNIYRNDFILFNFSFKLP